MDVKFDRDEFDKRQTALVCEIVRTIHDLLEENGTPPEALNGLTASLASRICSLLDGSRKGLKANDIGPLVPILGFALSTHRTDVVLLDGESSWMHEYVHGWVSELYDNTPVRRFQKPTAPCPHCGEPLRTPTASYCRFCKMDWRDPSNVHKRE